MKLLPGIISFETECIQEVCSTHSRPRPKLNSWLIEIPKNQVVQLKSGTVADVWIVSKSKKYPPQKPVRFRSTIEQRSPSLRFIRLPPAIVSQGDISKSRKVVIYILPTMQQDAGVLVNYLTNKKIQFEYTEDPSVGVIDIEKYLFVFGGGYSLSTFHSTPLEKLDHDLYLYLLKQFQEIDFQKVPQSPPPLVLPNHYTAFKLSVRKNLRGIWITIYGALDELGYFPNEFLDFLRLITILARSGAKGLNDHLREQKVDFPKIVRQWRLEKFQEYLKESRSREHKRRRD